MSNYIKSFKRKEKKYLITEQQYTKLMEKMKDKMQYDKFAHSTICNIYFDTPNFELIRRSIDKPVYKEKFRIRSYNVATPEKDVFLEIKKKFDGIVYKRRVAVPYKDIESYHLNDNKQIVGEIDWFLAYYKEIQPMMFISYNREALKGIDDVDLRITFDTELLYRVDNLDLGVEVYGEYVLDSNLRIMEIKTSLAMPLWLSEALDELKIYPGSFSKYGEAYKKYITENDLAEAI